jgi:hypothetical protein
MSKVYLVLGIGVVVYAFYWKLRDYFFTSQIKSDSVKEISVNDQIVKTKDAIQSAQEAYNEALDTYNRAKSDPDSNK